MGTLITRVKLPKQISLTNWGVTEDGVDINGIYDYISFPSPITSFPLEGTESGVTYNLYASENGSEYSLIYSGGTPIVQGYKHSSLESYMFYDGSQWVLWFDGIYQWVNPNGTQNTLLFNNWQIYIAQGPAGNIKNTDSSIKKNISFSVKTTNTGSSKIQLYKKFLPNALQGLALWLKADAGVTLAGSNVTSWADQSGNGNNATSPTTPPTFISSSINSKPAISFNNDGSWMRIPPNSIGNSGNITVFVVIDYTSGGIILNKGDGAAFEGTEWEMAPQNGFGYVRNDDGDFSWNVVVFTPSGLSLITMITTSGITELLNNNASEGNSSNATPINAISQYIGIGGGGTEGGTTAALNAKIPEIIIYNRAITTPERQQVEAYLNEKYAIYEY